MTFLQNPKNLKCDFDALSEKIAAANTILSQNTTKGGQPFVYAFCADKKHILDDTYTVIPKILVKEKKIVFYKTACTDGKTIYWHPKFLEKLSPYALSVIIAHEAFHIVFQHCNKDRCSNLNPKVWNIAVDYAVNAIIEKELFTNSTIFNTYNISKTNHPLWSGKNGLHKPYTLEELIKDIRESNKKDDEEEEITCSCEKDKEKLDLSEFEEDHEWEPNDADMRLYADVSQYGRAPEEIYYQIMDEANKKKGNGGGKDGLAGIAFGNADAHEPFEVDRNKILSDILNAATSAKRMSAGKTPGCIDDIIGELQDPKMKWQDVCNTIFNKKRVDNGRLNNWSKIRRRTVSAGVYLPKFCDYKVKWLAGLDTSGSMSVEDMTFGLSQLKSLDPRCEGTLVCWDAEVYWDHAKTVKSVNDLSHTKVIGRGGTVVNDFFESYQQKLKHHGPFDLLILITDGGLFNMDFKKPDVEVVWVITSGIKDFKPPFGKVCSLRGF